MVGWVNRAGFCGAASIKGYGFLGMKIVGPDGKILAVSMGCGINSLEFDPVAYGIKDKLGDSIGLESMNRLRQNITALLASVIVDKFQRLSM